MKYIFTFSIFHKDEEPSIIEVGPVANCVSEFPIYTSNEDFARIIRFHSDTENHCPMLSQGWISRAIDTWEEYSDWILYDTKQTAVDAATKFKERIK
jgi:hypothetical protein